jgi:hypothetical protein
VFHAAFLKKFEGTLPEVAPPLPQIVRGRTVPVPQAVVRAKPTGNSWELLVRWEGSSLAEATWEQLEPFKEAYPDFQKQYCRKKGNQVGPSSG